MYPETYLYSKEHEWVSIDGELATIGVTRFAQDELGDVVFVELPEVGQEVQINDEIGTIESVKAVAEVYTPLAGTVAEINELLVEKPELINEKPHSEGWLFKLRLASNPEEGELMDAEQYAAFTAGA